MNQRRGLADSNEQLCSCCSMPLGWKVCWQLQSMICALVVTEALVVTMIKRLWGELCSVCVAVHLLVACRSAVCCD